MKLDDFAMKKKKDKLENELCIQNTLDETSQQGKMIPIPIENTFQQGAKSNTQNNID